MSVSLIVSMSLVAKNSKRTPEVYARAPGSRCHSVIAQGDVDCGLAFELDQLPLQRNPVTFAYEKRLDLRVFVSWSETSVMLAGLVLPVFYHSLQTDQM
jgi:hypothetical protein